MDPDQGVGRQPPQSLPPLYGAACLQRHAGACLRWAQPVPVLRWQAGSTVPGQADWQASNSTQLRSWAA